MTTLYSDSSPELAGKGWVQLIARFGVGPVLALIFAVAYIKDVRANQAAILETKALVQLHSESSSEKLERIAKQLEANCRVQVLLANKKAIEPLCEVGR